MAYTWQEKVVYIRETTNGKTKWVKIPDITVRRALRTHRFEIRVDNRSEYKKIERDFGFEKNRIILDPGVF